MGYSEREIKIAKGARDYCEKTGSMYFEYTDASNELVDAFEAGVEFCENELIKAKIQKLESELKKRDELLREAIKWLDMEYGDEFLNLPEVKKYLKRNNPQ